MSIYGYWIAADDIIEVPQWGHEGTAYDILKDKHGIDTGEIEGSVYDVMFYLGYVRVVNEYGQDGGHKAQHWQEAKHSKLQKQFIKEAEIVDTWNLTEREKEACAQLTRQTA
jgi:hypothetical protein